MGNKKKKKAMLPCKHRVDTGLFLSKKYLKKTGFLCIYVTLIPRWHMDYLEIMLLSYLQLKGKKKG